MTRLRTDPGRLLTGFVAFALMTGCTGGGSEAAAPESTGVAPTTIGTNEVQADRACRAHSPSSPAPSAAVAAALADMALEQKVAQLFVVGFHGTSVDEPGEIEATYNDLALGFPSIAEAIRYGIGGVVIFSRNADEATAMTRLTTDLQSAAASGDHPGVLIAIDHEGGDVARIKDGMVVFPGQAVLGAINDATLTESVASATAEQLNSMGVNVVLGPVADVAREDHTGVLDTRSFSIDAETVTDHVGATVRGTQNSDIGAAVKHFPGMGDATTDPHAAMPVVSTTWADWIESHAPPFAEAVAAGAAIILVGHGRFPELDSTSTPSTVSAAIVGGELRGCLGFEGVVMTDAFEMGAVGSIGTQGDAALGALLAGADVILAPSDLAAAHAAIMAAVADGRLTEARIDISVQRVLTLKEHLGILDASAIPAPPGIGEDATAAYRELAASVTEACKAAGIDC